MKAYAFSVLVCFYMRVALETVDCYAMKESAKPQAEKKQENIARIVL